MNYKPYLISQNLIKHKEIILNYNEQIQPIRTVNLKHVFPVEKLKLTSVLTCSDLMEMVFSLCPITHVRKCQDE